MSKERDDDVKEEERGKTKEIKVRHDIQNMNNVVPHGPEKQITSHAGTTERNPPNSLPALSAYRNGVPNGIRYRDVIGMCRATSRKRKGTKGETWINRT